MGPLVQSLEDAVGAGVHSLISMAGSLVGNGTDKPGNDASPASQPAIAASGSTASPIPISAGTSHHTGVALAEPGSSAPPPPSRTTRMAFAAHDSLVQLTDVPSGWIHLQSTYLDSAGGQKRVRSFGLKNVSDQIVNIELDSDLGQQVVFWVGDDEKVPSSSASTTSSLSSTAGVTSLTLSIPVATTTTIFLAFQPTSSPPSTPLVSSSPSTDGGFTPRVAPAGSDLSPVPRLRSPGTSMLSDAGSASGSVISSISGGPGSRRLETVHRAFSVHGSVQVRATTQQVWEAPDELSPAPPLPVPVQSITLPFFASVCRSFFSAAVIDPATGTASGNQVQSGQLSIDFGNNAVGQDVYRDIIIVNRSEIDLVWSTAVVNARYKDSAWFSLRDLDSENVFGVDRSTEAVPLPALSSRHLRLSLRATAPVSHFDFDFVISNVHQSGNVITCRAIGSSTTNSQDETLRIVSGASLDFGQIHDGSWAKKMLVTKNLGDRPIDVNFSATPGFEVVFRLAGVAGEDVDEDWPVRPRDKRTEQLSRTSTREGSSRSRDVSSSYRYTPSEATSSAYSSARRPFTEGSIASSDLRTEPEDWAAQTNSDREGSIPGSRPLSRVTSRASSYRMGRESDDEDPPPQIGSLPEVSQELVRVADNLGDKDIPNQIEELTMRPGTEYRVFAIYRPARDVTNPPEIAGKLRTTNFKLFLDWTPLSTRSRPSTRAQETINCTAESCTSIIDIPSGHLIDFGEVTVGASKSTTIQIRNLSDLSARVEVAAISKVLNTNRNVVVIPPHETVNERIDFFPRRINHNYEKQVFVRNHLNRENNQLIDVRSKNVDVYNVTLHSHLYKILTPGGTNFLDFGSVVVNSPSVRTLQFQNLSHKPLVLELTASSTEELKLYGKAADMPIAAARIAAAKHALHPEADRTTNGHNLKERFVESLQERDQQGEQESKQPNKSKRDKSVTRKDKDSDKASVGSSLISALRKGGRGKHVQIYGNSVVFKDRNLLDDDEYLDLASGPPISSHRVPLSSKRMHLLEQIALEDKSKLSGRHPRVPKLDFAASAKSNGLYRKEPVAATKIKKSKSVGGVKRDPSTPTKTKAASKEASPPSPSHARTPIQQKSASGSGSKSPALTGKRAEVKAEHRCTIADVGKLSVDELIVALEHQESKRLSSQITHLSPEEEEHYVRKLIALRKELRNAVNNNKLVETRILTVPPGASRQLVVLMTPNVANHGLELTRAKRNESRIYIKLLDYDRSALKNVVGASLSNLEMPVPVRDLLIRSSVVRSVLEVQQSSINFGTCERGEVKSRTIVIHNKSDTAGVFRMRTSGSIASGNLKLGLGRYGVISAFGRKEVASFSFTPTMVGNYQETIVVENVLDQSNDQNVLVKAAVRRMPIFSLDLTKLDIVPSAEGDWPAPSGVVLTNASQKERTFVVEAAEPVPGAFANVTLSLDEKDAGAALSKEEEEEVEAMLQKLKIARRKGKADKISKYEKRLTELGVPVPAPADGGGDSGVAPKDEPSTSERTATAIEASGTASPPGEPVVETSPATEQRAEAWSRALTVTLQPNKKANILVKLSPSDSGSEPLATTVKVFEHKNTDEVASIEVNAQPKPAEVAPVEPKAISQEPLNLAIMRHCLDLTLKCPVSQTAFCVGSTLFLPIESPLYSELKGLFPVFNDPSTGKPAGLILADGYSRQIPGNTHAEANAVSNFRDRWTEIEDARHEAQARLAAEHAAAVAKDEAAVEVSSSGVAGHPMASADDVLAQSECFATMEPCSVRTSGGPSCALELVRAHVKKVFLGVEEPPDFVQCEGVRILEDGGVEVRRVVGLEENCLEAARRGRS